MKIVVLDGYAANPGDLSWEAIGKLGALTVYDRTPVAETAARIGDARAVLLNKAPLTREDMERCPNLGYVGVMATGYNIVDVAAAKERGIVVTNAPGYSTAAVAQLTMALLLELCHRAGAHSDAVHAGRWTACPDFAFWDYPLVELDGKTMGLVGFGAIGRRVAAIAQAMGMRVLVHSRTRRPELESDTLRFVELEELVAAADVVSLHCPLTPQTQGLFDADRIGRMKDGAMLINTARGPLLEERALRDALDSGKLAGAAMDVVTTEPIPGDSPLLGAPGCIITPHFGWAPYAARVRLMDIVERNLRAFLEGSPVNVVNP